AARDLTLYLLRALSEPQRVALILADIEGMTMAEIAEAMGTSEGRAQKRVQRARAAFREEGERLQALIRRQTGCETVLPAFRGAALLRAERDFPLEADSPSGSGTPAPAVLGGLGPVLGAALVAGGLVLAAVAFRGCGPGGGRELRPAPAAEAVA